MKSVALIPIFLLLLAGPSRGQDAVDNACTDGATRDDLTAENRDARRSYLADQRQAILAQQARAESDYQAAMDDVAARRPRLQQALDSARLRLEGARLQVAADNQHISENTGYEPYDTNKNNPMPRDSAKDQQLRSYLKRDQEQLKETADNIIQMQSELRQMDQAANAAKIQSDSRFQAALNCVDSRTAELNTLDAMGLQAEVNIAQGQIGERLQKSIQRADPENQTPRDVPPPIGGPAQGPERITTMPPGMPTTDMVDQMEEEQLREWADRIRARLDRERERRQRITDLPGLDDPQPEAPQAPPPRNAAAPPPASKTAPASPPPPARIAGLPPPKQPEPKTQPPVGGAPSPPRPPTQTPSTPANGGTSSSDHLCCVFDRGKYDSRYNYCWVPGAFFGNQASFKQTCQESGGRADEAAAGAAQHADVLPVQPVPQQKQASAPVPAAPQPTPLPVQPVPQQKQALPPVAAAPAAKPAPAAAAPNAQPGLAPAPQAALGPTPLPPPVFAPQIAALPPAAAAAPAAHAPQAAPTPQPTPAAQAAPPVAPKIAAAPPAPAPKPAPAPAPQGAPAPVAQAAPAPAAQAAPAPPPSQQSAAPNPPPASAPAQQAGCHTDNFNFSAVLSDKVSTKAVSTGGAPCSIKVAPQHPDQVQFTSASIEKHPSGGGFTQEGPFAFKYQPTSGFKGSDQYGIKVCGHNSQRAGCATITFNVTVQ